MKWLHFILSHSIFIALCSVALCFQTALLLHIELPAYLYGFIFFSTLSSYNFYWLVSACSFSAKPIPVVLKQYASNTVVFIIAIAGLFFTVLHLAHLLPVIIGGLALTLLYTLPLLPFKIFRVARKAGLVKTFLLAFTWAYVTVYIPYVQAPPGNILVAVMLFNNRFLFMLMLCIIFDVRDTNVDKIRGLQSLATIIKPSTVRYIMTGVFAAFIINGIFLRVHYHDTGQIIALLITGIVTAVVYSFSLKKQDYFFYYFIVDGLMLFSAMATYVASI
jgi:4-hydroxybenzoate polyprenyltransferase